MKQLSHPRNRHSDLVTPTSWRNIVSLNGSPVTDVTYSAPGESMHTTIGDTVNKGWRRLQRRGTPVLSSMTLERRSRLSGGEMVLSFNFTTGTGANRSVSMIGDFSSSGFEVSVRDLFPDFLENDLGTMEYLAITKAFANVNKSDIVIGESLADFTKTAMMLRRPYKSAIDLLGRMVKTRNRKLVQYGHNFAKANANTWLEYCYGWKPLLLDAETIIDAAHKKREFGGEIRVARAEVKREIRRTESFSFGALTDPQWNRSGSASRTETARACSGVLYRINNCTPSDRIAKLFGTRATDLPATVWEIIPFSFVVDWFVNVGDWINASMPDPNYTVLGSWTTCIYKDILKINECSFKYSEYVKPGEYARASALMNLSQNTREWVQRDVESTVSTTPVVKGISLSLPHSLSALSLLYQQFARNLMKMKH